MGMDNYSILDEEDDVQEVVEEPTLDELNEAIEAE